MSDLSRIVSVNISRETKAVTQKGFGVGLILGDDDSEKPGAQTTRTAVYFDLASLAADYADTTEVYKAALAYFGQSIKPEKVIVGFMEGAETVSEALVAIKDENDSWYAVGITSRTQADQEALAAFIETDCRIAGVASNSADVLNPALDTDIASVLNLAGRERTFVIYSSNADTQYPEFAWMGKVLPKDPGSVTWKFKNLSGITADNLTATNLTTLGDKKCNFYHEFGGQNITEEGWMASGEFIDVMRGVDFIQARMQEAIYSRLVNLDKIPYTNQGVDLIVNEMESVLSLAIGQEILANDPEPVVNKPDVRDIAFNDRVARLLPDIEFIAYLAGAVHQVKIEGNVTV